MRSVQRDEVRPRAAKVDGLESSACAGGRGGLWCPARQRTEDFVMYLLEIVLDSLR
jgi:hypothetical protein